jgi:Rrf2 family iron-sulfur cluster assembly transcriptional regulator
MYGKQAKCAIAAMTRLAEVYDGGQTRLSAQQIADACGLSRPFVAKMLSVLTLAGLAIGARGPGGGCTLARDPKLITLDEVLKLFERADDGGRCPFRAHQCDAEDPCPLHHKLVAVQQGIEEIAQTTFEEFRAAYQNRKQQPAKRARRKAQRKGPSDRS